MNSKNDITNSTIYWFEKAVLGLNLCPFAAKPYKQGSIIFELSTANNDEECLLNLLSYLKRLEESHSIETMVVICPYHLDSFEDYNQFLELTDLLIEQEGWSGTFQIASFHPDYVFSGSDFDDRSNWTNRSPYPLFHLIRESSIDKAVKSHSNINDIPKRNIELLRSLGNDEMKEIFQKDF